MVCNKDEVFFRNICNKDRVFFRKLCNKDEVISPGRFQFLRKLESPTPRGTGNLRGNLQLPGNRNLVRRLQVSSTNRIRLVKLVWMRINAAQFEPKIMSLFRLSAHLIFKAADRNAFSFIVVTVSYGSTNSAHIPI